MGQEALPLRGDAREILAIVALTDSGDEQRATALEARGLQIDVLYFVHSQRLHEFHIVEAPFGANDFGSDSEVIAERTRECLVRAVSVIQGNRQDVSGAVRQRTRRLRESSTPDIAHDR